MNGVTAEAVVTDGAEKTDGEGRRPEGTRRGFERMVGLKMGFTEGGFA